MINMVPPGRGAIRVYCGVRSVSVLNRGRFSTYQTTPSSYDRANRLLSRATTVAADPMHDRNPLTNPVYFTAYYWHRI